MESKHQSLSLKVTIVNSEQTVTHFLETSRRITFMKSTMSVVKSSKVAQINKSSVIAITKKKSFKKFNIKKNIICCGNLRGNNSKMTTMFRGMMCLGVHRVA